MKKAANYIQISPQTTRQRNELLPFCLLYDEYNRTQNSISYDIATDFGESNGPIHQQAADYFYLKTPQSIGNNKTPSIPQLIEFQINLRKISILNMKQNIK